MLCLPAITHIILEKRVKRIALLATGDFHSLGGILGGATQDLTALLSLSQTSTSLMSTAGRK